MIHVIERSLPGMSERRVSEIVAERDRLHQIFIQPQSLCDRPGILGNLQRMRQPGPVMVSAGQKKDLCLLLQPPECLAVEDPVPVSLEDRADITLWLLRTLPFVLQLNVAYGLKLLFSLSSSCSLIVMVSFLSQALFDRIYYCL